MRELDTATLDGAAQYYAGLFLANRPPFDRGWVMGQLHNLVYKDEFDHLVKVLTNRGASGLMGGAAIKAFEALAGNAFPARNEKVLEGFLAKKLAVDLDGGHIPGAIGRTQLGQRGMGLRAVTVEHPASIAWRKFRGKPKSERWTHEVLAPHAWPVYAGETEERIAGNIRKVAGQGPGADPLPPEAEPLSVGAFATRIANAAAINACDAIVDLLDGGTGAAVIEGRTTPRPANVDDAVTGTLLFTQVCSDPAFLGAADAAPGGRATASAVTADPSAAATGTLLFCRASSSNDGATPLVAYTEGEAGTSASDFVYPNLSIVSGAEVGLTSWTGTQPES